MGHSGKKTGRLRTAGPRHGSGARAAPGTDRHAARAGTGRATHCADRSSRGRRPPCRRGWCAGRSRRSCSRAAWGPWSARGERRRHPRRRAAPAAWWCSPPPPPPCAGPRWLPAAPGPRRPPPPAPGGLAPCRGRPASPRPGPARLLAPRGPARELRNAAAGRRDGGRRAAGRERRLRAPRGTGLPPPPPAPLHSAPGGRPGGGGRWLPGHRAGTRGRRGRSGGSGMMGRGREGGLRVGRRLPWLWSEK